MNSKELAELIHQNTRIILPEFGAFLVKDGGEKGFNPSNVSFSPFLRYNDGMLEVYIAKSRGISKEEASKDVREFVETVKNELLEKGVFEVEGLGQLKRDQRGSLSFSLSQVGEKKIQEEKIVSKTSAIKKEITTDPIESIEKFDTKKSVEHENDNITEEQKGTKTKKASGLKAKIEKVPTSKKAIKKSAQEEIIQREPIQESISTPIMYSIPQPKQDDIITPKLEIKTERLQDEKTENKVAQIENKSDQKIEERRTAPPEIKAKKKRGFAGLIYTGVIIAILVALFFIIKNYYLPPRIEPIKDSLTSTKKPESIISDKIDANDKIEKPKDDIDKAYNELSGDKKVSKEQIKKEKEQEDAIAKALIKDAQIKNTQIKNTENETSVGVKYHVIAGSFKNPDFANKYLNELNNSGFSASIVIQNSGMNAVSIGSFSTREEANEAMKNYKSKLPNLWILKK